MGKRWIVHLDMDAFFVSVEVKLDPSLKNKPVVVGGNPNSRGVVSSASYEARKCGIKSAMPLYRAKELCPSAIFLKPRFFLYKKYSEKIYLILKKYAPVVERASIDEFYLDLTGCERLYGDICSFSFSIKEKILKETGLPCSIGLGSNKFIAKIASQEAKPDGFIFVPHGEEINFLSPLPIGKMPGIGKKTEKRLKEMGIKTIGDINKFQISFLTNSFGKFGEYLWKRAKGIDFSQVKNTYKRKSLSQEVTFPKDSDNKEFLKKILIHLVEELCFRLREQDLKTRTITLKIRYSDFKTITRSVTVKPTNADNEIYKVAKNLLEKVYTRRVRIRLIGLRFSNLLRDNTFEFLFPDSFEIKKSSLFKGVDIIRKKFGDIVHLGSYLKI